MEEIKNIFFFLLLGGKEIKEEQLFTMFAELADLSDISDEKDFSNVGVNSTTIFAENSFKYFLEEQYDEWIDYYKNKLLKLENYELIKYLDL